MDSLTVCGELNNSLLKHNFKYVIYSFAICATSPANLSLFVLFVTTPPLNLILLCIKQLNWIHCISMERLDASFLSK